MPPSYFPLRWESTGDKWWYASPIDWAAANGHFELVLELLRIDTNLLIKLTSLHRIHRLETVWDDEVQFADVAKCRSAVARSLLHECQNKKGKNSLIHAGYGGWLLYTAASAGDVDFIQELLERDPLLVFGEGEYGVTDIFYAAARSKNSEVFRLLFDYAVWPRCVLSSVGEFKEQSDVPLVFKWEMMNRAAHAAARGGNLEILKEFLGECSGVLDYRDAQGSTVLHAAAGRGQAEVVKDLVRSFNIVTSMDNQGNTALHVAAYKGHLAVVEALIQAYPSSMWLKNNSGDTFLHMVVAGFRSPGFRRVDRQIELVKQLVGGKVVNLQEIINIRNNNGRTAIHMAVIGNIHSNLVELLMSVPSIDLNILDMNYMTPLDLLRQHTLSASSEILIKQLISAGGISNSQDYMARDAIVSHLKMQGMGSSPGTSFRISDAEIFLYTGTENSSDVSVDRGSARLCSCSSTSKSEISHKDFSSENHDSSGNKKSRSVNSAAKGLKKLLRWPGPKEKKVNCSSAYLCKLSDEIDSVESYEKSSDLEKTPTPLRHRFSKPSALPNNKRTLSVRNSLPSPSTKKKFTAGLMHGVLQAMPHLAVPSNSASTSRSRSSFSSPKEKVLSDNETSGPCFSKSSRENRSNNASPKTSSANIHLMNQYFCFGAQDLTVEDSVSEKSSNQAYKPSLISMA